MSMESTATALELSSIDISLISATVSIFSLFVASYLAWKTKFSPPKLVGSFPYVIIWSFDGGDKYKVGDEYLIPYIWVSNVGATPILIDEIRLTIHPNGGKRITLYPIHSVPIAAIERPNSYSDFEEIRIGEAPFMGFPISNGEQWKNVNAFHISTEDRALLKGHVKLVFEVRELNSKRYKPVITENIDFVSEEDEPVNWLRFFGEGGPMARYYNKVK